MNILYIDASMGAAGDMLTAALTELMPEPAEFVKRLNMICIPGVTYESEPLWRCGITGTHITVRINGETEEDYHHDDEEHHHTGLHDIENIVTHLDIPDKVKKDVMAVYNIIAEAESRIHGVDMSDIHFHEVGTMDAVADITAVCLAMNELAPEKVIVSPVHVGKGSVECAHGILPVPAPATVEILHGVPIYGNIEGELCTPTGAALLKYFADSFGDMPVMTCDTVGYGMGSRDYARANCVRIISGTTEGLTEKMSELSFCVDDMTAEDIAFAVTMLFAAGARDVYTVPVSGKKSRTATLIRIVCDDEAKSEIIHTAFAHTSTLGMRETAAKRYLLDRRIEEMRTPLGRVRRKISTGYGVTRIKYEHDDLERIAAQNNMSIEEVRKQIENEDA
ncbi:MAG: nickel pincer cofactor biosynthesis protein LarC [Oscillospiraceae bacterium]|nr:nickel pincer cofactor biosynthesis protein LarC [Oscillospiraceae bacterium]